MDEQQRIKNHMEELIRDDNSAEFISLLASRGNHACYFSPSELLTLICMHRAVGCATSLLEQHSGLCIDVNAALEGGLSPLQLASQSLSFSLTSLLLKHGAQADVSGDEHGATDLSMLPLYVALKAVRDQWASDWSPEKSIFKLLYILCLQDLKEPLDTINLLAEKTENIEKLCLYCVDKGEVVHLAALLKGA